MQLILPWVAALWWGSLTSLCFLIVPLLFWHLPVPAMAGTLAAKLFSAQTWVTLVCGLVLFVLETRVRTNQADYFPIRTWVIGGILMAFIVEFALSPRIVARENLRMWHTLGSLMYFLQWVCAGVTLHRTLARRIASQV